MPISYRIYMNDGRGGEVNYARPVSTTSGQTFTFGPLATPGDTTFAVRCVDPGTGIEEANTDARVRIVLDEAGNDVTAKPGRVLGLAARPSAGGICRVTWGYLPTPGETPPVQFAVSLTPGTDPDLSRVAAVIPYGAGTLGYECTLSGLVANAPFVVAVRAIGSSPLLAGDPSAVSVRLAVARLQDVEGLTGTASA